MKTNIKRIIMIIMLIFAICLNTNCILADEGDEPITDPTVAPDPTPVEEPTAEPTVEPTEEPTSEPTEEPTEEPTSEPESTPTPSEKPSTETNNDPDDKKVGDDTGSSSSSSSSSEYVNIQVNTVYKSENNKEDLNNLGISSLKIEAIYDDGHRTTVELTPKFDVNAYIYECMLDKEVQNLEIVTELVNEDWKAEIIGNNLLVDGENIITLLVRNDEKNENITYQIKAYRSNVPTKVDTNGQKKKSFKIDKIGVIIIIVVSIISLLLIVLIIRTFTLAKRDKELDAMEDKKDNTEGKHE